MIIEERRQRLDSRRRWSPLWGHVDHGKTSRSIAIRKNRGPPVNPVGITQHIRARTRDVSHAE